MGKSLAIHTASGARTADARENIKSRDPYISLISRIFADLEAEPTNHRLCLGRGEVLDIRKFALCGVVDRGSGLLFLELISSLDLLVTRFSKVNVAELLSHVN
jgi:hypothetical protein